MNSFLKDKEIDNIIFKLGVFLLPSAISISIFLFIISIINLSIKEKIFALNTTFKKIFFTNSLFLILSSISHSFSNNKNANAFLSLIGLLNWIPLFVLFFVSKFYLKTNYQRQNISSLLLAGSIPLIITGLGQVYFNWTGPWIFLNGLITWYLKPVDFTGGLTGLFNNVNYAGLWLNMIFPICLVNVKLQNQRYKKIFFLLYAILIFICIILTNSRSSWFCLIFSCFLIFRKKFLKYFLFVFSLFGSILISSIFLFRTMKEFLTPLTYGINPFNLKFSDYFIEIFNFGDRLNMWLTSLKIIIENPIWGNGVGSFTKIYFSETGLIRNHTHNIILELLVNYGLPATLFTITPIVIIIFLAFKKSFIIENSINLDQAWVTALLSSLILHLVDIQYYDGKISILNWIILAGISNIFISKKFE